MFMRPGFAKSIRDSRNDQPRVNDDENFIMTDIHHGTAWHDLETNIVREIGEFGAVRDQPADGIAAKKLTAHRYGLHLTMNTDWYVCFVRIYPTDTLCCRMGILENRPHSTGAIYFAINDLPRDERFLQINIICAAVLPGPKEPNVQQINHCLEPSTKELMVLKGGKDDLCVVYNLTIILNESGVHMDVADEDEQVDVYADNEILDCDMPAAHKLSGTAGHSHDMHPCLYCDIDVTKINTREGYDYSTLRLALMKPATQTNGFTGWTASDDNHLLRQSFYSRDANPIRQRAILDDHGVRWSILNLIAGWFPSRKTALDFMHCVFLGMCHLRFRMSCITTYLIQGIIAHLFMRVLFAGYMISGIGGRESPKQRFEALINSVKWPSHITRLPKNVRNDLLI